MRKNSLNFNKQLLVDEAFYKVKDTKDWNNTNIDFCEETFEIYEPNFCGGSIRGNCNILSSEEFKVLDTFDVGYLDELEKEMAYIQKLINTRKSELAPIENKIELNVDRYKLGNKKICLIFVKQFNIHTDIYGDSIETDHKTLEQHKYSDTKQFQEEIDKKIEELKNKYNIN